MSMSSKGASVVADRHAGMSHFAGLLGSAMKGVSPKQVSLTIFFLLLFALMLSPKNWLLSAIDHEIDQFSVEGALVQVSQGEISEKVSSWLGSSFLLADLDEIKASVESLPWVYQATVNRVWPGQIVLVLEEQSAAAYWNGSAFLNGNGEVFTPEVIDQVQALPRFEGPEDSSIELRAEMMREMGSVQAMLAPHGLLADSLMINERGSWEMMLSNGIAVALGERPFDDKIARVVSVLESTPEVSHQRMARFDARYPNGVAVKWKEIALAADLH